MSILFHSVSHFCRLQVKGKHSLSSVSSFCSLQLVQVKGKHSLAISRLSMSSLWPGMEVMWSLLYSKWQCQLVQAVSSAVLYRSELLHLTMSIPQANRQMVCQFCCNRMFVVFPQGSVQHVCLGLSHHKIKMFRNKRYASRENAKSDSPGSSQYQFGVWNTSGVWNTAATWSWNRKLLLCKKT